jgi:ribosomal RNA-processing protein 12
MALYFYPLLLKVLLHPLFFFSSLQMRLKCIASLIHHQTASYFKSVPSLVADVILCTKDQNQKTRNEAFHILSILAHKYSDQLEEYFRMILGGLGGTTPHMISATILSISHLLFEFSGQLSAPFLQSLLAPFMALLQSNNREILLSELNFFKVVTGKLPTEVFQPHLKDFVRLSPASSASPSSFLFFQC